MFYLGYFLVVNLTEMVLFWGCGKTKCLGFNIYVFKSRGRRFCKSFYGWKDTDQDISNAEPVN